MQHLAIPPSRGQLAVGLTSIGRVPVAVRQAGITTNCDVLVGYFGGTELKIRRAADSYRPAPRAGLAR